MRRIVTRVTSSLQYKTAFQMGFAVVLAVVIGGAYIIKIQRDAQYEALDSQARALAVAGAQTAASVFNTALADGTLTKDQLFDTNYQQIAGGNPARYHTQFDAFTDKAMLKIEDGYLGSPDVVFAAIVDRNGYLPTHDTKYSQGTLADAANRTKRIFNDPVGLAAAKNETPLLKQTYKRDTGETMWDVSAPITIDGQHWGSFRVGFSIQRVDAAVSATTNRIILVLVAIVALVLAGSFLIGRRIGKSMAPLADRLQSLQDHCLTGLSGGMQALAAGDLTVVVTPVTPHIDRYSTDETGRAAESVNHIIDRMAATIASYNDARVSLSGLAAAVAENAGAVLDAAGQIGETSEQMAQASGQIASAMNEVSGSAMSLSDLAHTTSREVEDLGDGSRRLTAEARENASSAADSRQSASEMGERIAAVADASLRVSASADVSRTAAVQGADALHQAIESMAAIAAAVEDTSHTIDQLGEYGQQIGDIVRTIDEIAAQTNLLALNAAIEAARAGEQGRGFAVVADNVRGLAERSSHSTREIADLVSRVRSGTEQAVLAMARSVENVQAGQAITSQAGDALQSIISTVEESARAMEQIAGDIAGLAGGASRIVESADAIAGLAAGSAASAEDMAQGAARVTDAIMQVSAMSEETSAAAEEVSASTEELTAQTRELADTADHMRQLAATLEEAANRFKWERAKTLEAPVPLRPGSRNAA